MAVLPMKRVFIAALRKDRKPLLETLQRLGVVEIKNEDLAELTGGEDDGVFKKLDTTSARSTFEKNATLATQALEVLDASAPPEKEGLLATFAGRKQIDEARYKELVGKRENIMDMVYKLNSLYKQKVEAESEIPKLENEAEQLKPWLSFDVSLDFKGTMNTTAFIGTFPDKYDLESLYVAFGEKAPDAEAVDISIVSANDEQTCVFVICHNKDAKATEEGLRALGFARPPLPGVVPKEELERIKKARAECEGRISSVTSETAKYAPRRDELKFIIDYFTMRADKYEVISGLCQSKRTFILTGYVATKDTDLLNREIGSKFDCVLEFSDPAPEEDSPTVLKNVGYAKPVEDVVANYALPGKGEMDPTFLASLFYYCLFGLMLGDAGYGILITLGTAIILAKNKKTIEPGTKRMMQLFLGCGISTTFWGFMFGSFFGDAVGTIAKTFFGSSVAFNPIWFNPVDNPIKMLGFSFIIGQIQLYVGLGALGYTLLKDKKIKGFIYDVLFWYMFTFSLICLLIGSDMVQSMFGLSFTVPSWYNPVNEWMAIISGVGITLTGGRESRNWFKRILKGLFSLYGISNWLSDLLSYSRLLALGLATSIIGSVFNQMGSMFGASVGGAIAFIVIFLIGHALNIFINALGAYVHTNRLEYVEFFGKFYNGGGREMKPFTENTKYYRVV
jgi:V/A-type H+-transporting ATPase subunit I